MTRGRGDDDSAGNSKLAVAVVGAILVAIILVLVVVVVRLWGRIRTTSHPGANPVLPPANAVAHNPVYASVDCDEVGDNVPL